MKKNYKKILILGSGAIKIGQAGEFDYSGSQAIKALKEEGIETILINPNIATMQTSADFATRVYFLPVDAYFTEAVIKKEKPDGILLGFGGQTALNVGINLAKKGIFKKYTIAVLGSPIEAIINTEDRELFAKKIEEINLKVPQSKAASTTKEALQIADEIGYPIMCRIAFALGGLGSGVAYNAHELRKLAEKAFRYTKQILIEEYLLGWKEIECEIVRDNYNNSTVVCIMENLDPMGIHTGESIVVAPTQTLSAPELFKLRSMSIQVIRHLGIVGECNIQFALNPREWDYRIIEVNARLSRSSALASKATGYPLAHVATKLALGHNLGEVSNIVTKDTSACFEPALDYVVVKFPRWDLQKFRNIHLELGSEMKSVGEVMAIGRSFEEALEKAIRMLDIGIEGITGSGIEFTNIEEELTRPTDKRIFAIAEALKRGMTVDSIHELTKITPWFLYKMKNIVTLEKELKGFNLDTLPASLLLQAKQKGFSDTHIASIIKSNEKEVREKRKAKNIVPFVKQIDTLAAEYPAKTNYLYLTYNGDSDDIIFNEKKQIIVLGGGPYRIGSSVEFDWCCVNGVMALRKLGHKTIMINCNPETVSTDYDYCDKLYFDELSLERVLDIYEKEAPKGVVVSLGGQIPNNLALPLLNRGVSILGTAPSSIDRAEDRHQFSQMLDSLSIDQPQWEELTTMADARNFADAVAYPVLIRPSYVLSGAAMSVVTNEKELEEYLHKATNVSKKFPVVISKFITGAKEIEIDGVAGQGNLVVYAISEHVENAGVHSGDATIVFPPQRTFLETMRRIKVIAQKIARELKITGPFNIQFIAKDNDVKVIECNARASRSFPFVSKVMNCNFIELAMRSIMGEKISEINTLSFDLDYVGVKASQFSFTRLKGSDPVLGVEMASTGEVACMGDDFYEAFLKSMFALDHKLPPKSVLLSTGPIESKAGFLESAQSLQAMGIELYATKGTADFLKDNGVATRVLHWPLDKEEPSILSFLEKGKIDLVINIPKNETKKELTNGYLIRRKAIDTNIPLFTNLQLAKRLVEALSKTSRKKLSIKSWDEYC